MIYNVLMWCDRNVYIIMNLLQYDLQSKLAITTFGYNENLFKMKIFSNRFRVFWLTIANFIKKSGYNAYTLPYNKSPDFTKLY